jgi:predicted esterase
MKTRLARTSLLLLALALSNIAMAQERKVTTVTRYDDADEFLPPAERKNSEGVRLVLRQQPDEETLTVISDRNVAIKIVAKIPSDARGGVLLFTGGNGVLSMDATDRLDRSFSFLTRSRDQWWQYGLATFVIDAPSDRLDKSGLSVSFRASSEFRTDLAAVLLTIRAKFARPLYAVGISNGATAVANLATLNDAAVAMYVLLSPAHIASPGSELITSVSFTKPVLVVGSRRDECRYSPPPTFSTLASKVGGAAAEVVWIDGGMAPIGGPCGPFGFHSFFGAEALAVKSIAEKLK